MGGSNGGWARPLPPCGGEKNFFLGAGATNVRRCNHHRRSRRRTETTGREQRAAAAHQCKLNLEPSAAAVIIAGIPSARVASAIARASIMAIPLDSVNRTSFIGSLRNRLTIKHLPHAYFRRISPQRFWFRDLWQ